MKVADLLTDDSRWTQGENARDDGGFPIAAESEDAICWCLAGAIKRCYGDEDEVLRVLRIVHNRLNTQIDIWNDAPERTFADVRALIEALDL